MLKAPRRAPRIAEPHPACLHSPGKWAICLARPLFVSLVTSTPAGTLPDLSGSVSINWEALRPVGLRHFKQGLIRAQFGVKGLGEDSNRSSISEYGVGSPRVSHMRAIRQRDPGDGYGDARHGSNRIRVD